MIQSGERPSGAKAWTPSLLPVSRLTLLKLAVTRYQRNKIKLVQGAQFIQYRIKTSEWKNCLPSLLNVLVITTSPCGGCGAHARDQAAARQQCEGGDHYSGVATACHQSYGPPASWSSAASQPHQPQSGPEQRAADTVAGADTGQQPSWAGRVQCAVWSVIISIKCCHQLPPVHCQPGCLAVYQQLQSTFLSCYCHEGGH